MVNRKALLLVLSYTFAIILMLLFGYLMGIDISKKPVDKQNGKFIKSLFLPMVCVAVFSSWVLDKYKLYPTKNYYWKYTFMFVFTSFPLLSVFILTAISFSNVSILYAMMLSPGLILLLVFASIQAIILHIDENSRGFWQQKKYYITLILFLIMVFISSMYFHSIDSDIAFVFLSTFWAIVSVVLSLWELNQTIKKTGCKNYENHSKSKT